MNNLKDTNFEIQSIAHESSLDTNFKKNNGIFYTDIELANAIIEFLKIPKKSIIIDPCCGTGSFLYSLKTHGYKRVFGCDFDESTVLQCKKLTKMRNVKCIDTLGNSGQHILQQINKKQFDYVIGNPPYASINKNTKLKSDTFFCNEVKESGNNLFIAALYRAFEICKDSGIVSVIVPKNLLHISSYKKIREKLLKEKKIISIIELGIHFKAVRGEQIVLTFQNCITNTDNKINFYSYNKGKITQLSSVLQSYYSDEIIVFTSEYEVSIYNKLKSSYDKLGKICIEYIHRGHDKSNDAVKGKQIRKFGFKNRNVPNEGNQIFIQNIFSAEAGITASFAGNLKSEETVTIVKMENEKLCKYILGLLHSRVCNYFLIRFEFNNSRLTIHTDAKYLNQIPIVVDNIAMDNVINIVNKMEKVIYMSTEWFELNETLNTIVYDIYKLSKKDKQHIENEMRKISASKWYNNNIYTTQKNKVLTRRSNMNNEMAYLLGMIMGNGEVQRGLNETTIVIEIPHKKLKTEFEKDVSIYVKASITDIREIIEPLVGTGLRFSQSTNVSYISFTKPNEDYLIREIIRYIGGATSHNNVHIAPEVFNFTLDEKKQFIKGFADVTGYIRRSNYFFNKEMHRVYFEIPQNWNLVIDFCNLLKSVDIPVQNIDWAHPNMRDGNLKKYKEGKKDFWKKEHQVKVWANEYESIGFAVIHKNEALENFAHEQVLFIKSHHKKVSDVTHKYYWEMIDKKKTKPPHPSENDSFIPKQIRGNHYDSWKEIANDLGYKKNGEEK